MSNKNVKNLCQVHTINRQCTLLQKYILGIVRPIFKKELNSIEEFIKSERRFNLFENIIVKIMCTFEDTECQIFGEKVLENWYTNTNDYIRNL